MSKEIIHGQDVVRLLLQFCKENNLGKTYTALKEETDIRDNFLKNNDEFVQAFRAGRWDHVLLEMEDMTLPRGLVMDFFEHLVFELCEKEEFDLARHVVKEVMVQKSKQRSLSLRTAG